MGKGACVLPLLRDVLSHERPWPLPVKGWKMRHHRPDFKERPPMGVYVQERVSGGYKSTTMNTGPTSEPCCQLLLALRCPHKPSLAVKAERRGTVGIRTHTGRHPEASEKPACQLKLYRLTEKWAQQSDWLFKFKVDRKVFSLEPMREK